MVTKLGFPTVTDPRVLDLRAVQSIIAAVRERLRVLDSAVTNLQFAAGADTTATSLTALSQQLQQLQLRVTVVENSIGATDTIQLIVDDTIDAGAPVVATANGHCKLADPTDATAVHALLGLTATAGAAGQTIPVQRRGVLSIAGATFTTDQAVYVGLAGELTQIPNYGSVALSVGVAVSPSAVWIAPGEPSLLVSGLDPTYEPFMPASVELVSDALEFMTEFNAATNGLLVKFGTDNVTTRALQGTAGRITATNGSGVSGNPTFDLTAVSQAVAGTFQKFSVDGFGRVFESQPVVAADVTALVGSVYVDVAGDTMTGALTAPAFIPNGSAIPADVGVYRASAGNLSFAASGVRVAQINTVTARFGFVSTAGFDLAVRTAATNTTEVSTISLGPNGINRGRITVGGTTLNDGYMAFGTLPSGVTTVEGMRLDSGGQLAMKIIGKGLSIAEGANAKMGVSTLVAGTVVVNTTAVTANSRILLTYQSLGTITLPSSLGVSARTAGTSFTISSAALTDTSVVGWLIFEPS